MTRKLITPALVRDAGPPPFGRRKDRTWDTEITGFCVEVHSNGTKTYWLRYSDPRRRRREFKIGKHGDITTQQARRRAAELKACVTLGGDPAGDNERLRAIPTVATFVTDQFMPDARENLRSHAEYETMLRLHVLPAIGRLALDQVTAGDIACLRRKLMERQLSPARVNRTLAVVRRVFNLASRWNVYAGANPARFPGMLREEPRERFLNDVQFRALIMALNLDHDIVAASAIAMLAVTGARKSEVLGATWVNVDFDQGLLTVPLAKSGHPRHVILNDAAIAILRSQAREPGQANVFPSARRPGRPLEDVRGVWTRAKVAAGLPADLRLHDLRHNFASMAINNGATLYEVGKLLGHSQLSTTARYAHLSADRLHETANTVGRIATAKIDA
jgi:integrase